MRAYLKRISYISFIINIHLGIQIDSYDMDTTADETKTCPNTILVHKPTPLYTRPSACCGVVVTVESSVSPSASVCSTTTLQEHVSASLCRPMAPISGPALMAQPTRQRGSLVPYSSWIEVCKIQNWDDLSVIFFLPLGRGGRCPNCIVVLVPFLTKVVQVVSNWEEVLSPPP